MSNIQQIFAVEVCKNDHYNNTYFDTTLFDDLKKASAAYKEKAKDLMCDAMSSVEGTFKAESIEKAGIVSGNMMSCNIAVAEDTVEYRKVVIRLSVSELVIDVGGPACYCSPNEQDK